MKINITYNEIANHYLNIGLFPVAVKKDSHTHLWNAQNKAKECKSKTNYSKLFEGLKGPEHDLVLACGDYLKNFETISIIGNYDDAEKLTNEILLVDYIKKLVDEGKITIVKHRNGFDFWLFTDYSPTESFVIIEQARDIKSQVKAMSIGKGGFIFAPPTDGYEFLNKINSDITITKEERNSIIDVIRLFNEPKYKYIDSTNYGRIELVCDIADQFNKSNKITGIIKPMIRDVFKWKNISEHLWAKINSEGNVSVAWMEQFEQRNFVLSSITAEPFKANTQYTAFDFLVMKYNDDFLKAIEQTGLSFSRDYLKEINSIGRLKEKLDKAYVPLVEKHIKPTPYISIKSGNEFYIFGTVNNFSVISGKTKVGKTFILSYLMTSPFIEDKVFAIGKEILDKKIVFFDTEQARNDSRIINDRILRSTNRTANDLKRNFELFNITNSTPAERVNIIDEKLRQDNQIAIVVIDGIRDLLVNFNDPKEVANLINKMLKWKDEYSIHLIVVIHENKVNTHLRGHLGTELMNKAETIVGLTKTDNIIKMKCQMARNKEFEPLAFQITDDGLLEVIENYNMSIASRSLTKLKDEDFKAILNEIYNSTQVLKYDEVWKAIKQKLSEIHNIDIGDNKSKKLLTVLLEKGLITKNDKGYTITGLSV